MAQQLSRISGAVKEAICSASRTKDANTVANSATEYGFARAVTLAEMLSDETIDVVYVASANSAHGELCLSALRAGKHVLCEKPLTLSHAEAELVFAEAARCRRLIVDGTFTASLPAMRVIHDALPSIGDIQHVEVHKKIRTSISHANPIINSRELGGGLFDGAGSYSVHMLCHIFGPACLLALGADDVDVTSVASPDGEVDWETTVRLTLRGARVTLTHRAADDARESVVRGARGEIAFILPYLESVRVNDVVHDTSYGCGAPLARLADDAPGGARGLHPGLGVEALAVQRDVLAARARGRAAAADGERAGEGGRADGCSASQHLPLEVMRAMSHLMDLVRHQLPTHKYFRGAV